MPTQTAALKQTPDDIRSNGGFEQQRPAAPATFRRLPTKADMTSQVLGCSRPASGGARAITTLTGVVRAVRRGIAGTARAFSAALYETRRRQAERVLRDYWRRAGD